MKFSMKIEREKMALEKESEYDRKAKFLSQLSYT